MSELVAAASWRFKDATSSRNLVISSSVVGEVMLGLAKLPGVEGGPRRLSLIKHDWQNT
jgi:hypothetical protein